MHEMMKCFFRRMELVPMHDPMALSYLIEPEIFKFRRLHVEVELCGLLTRGETVADLRSRPGSEPNVNVCVDVNGKKFLEILVSRIAKI